MKTSIKKTKSEFKIIEIDNKKTFTISSKKQKLELYDERLIKDAIDKKFNDRYKKILYIIMEINNSSDSTETDNYLVREQINELKNILLNRYSKFLDKDTLRRYLNMLLILDSKIMSKTRDKGR